MGVKKRRKKKSWTVSEKHEIVLAKKQGLTEDELPSALRSYTIGEMGRHRLAHKAE